MALSRDKYVANTYESREKLVDHIIASSDLSELRNIAKTGLINHYIDCDQHFLDDYYHTFQEEDPELNGVQEEEDVGKITYYHGHHSNPCVVGEIIIPSSKGYQIKTVVITHNMICKEYGDNLSDITKVWDAQVKVESYGDRYSSEPDSCICIPVDLGEHTALANMLLKQILLDNNVEVVTLSQSYADQFKLEDFWNILDR